MTNNLILPKILYLEDEPQNILGLKSILRKNYELIGANTIEEGEKLLSQNEFHIVIADLKLKDKNGLDFLETVQKISPHTIKMLLTAHYDFDAALNGINKVNIFRYLLKPLNTEEVLAALKTGVEYYEDKKQLENKKIELEKAKEELNRFVYSASHDMRAPLRSILGIIKVAEMEGIDDRVRYYFELIEKSINQLDAFNVNLINYYKNSKQKSSLEIIDFKEIAREIFEQFQYFPGANEINFVINTNQTAQFIGDIFRIRIILNNLITNSIKFQKKDSNNKHILFSCDLHNPDLAIISFEDNGIGIEYDQQEKVFDMFYRATRENSGSGIGLYIVKEAMEKLNAKIYIESKPNIGTKFILEIPNKKIK